MNNISLANTSSMFGANSFTMTLFDSAKAMQSQMLSQMSSNTESTSMRIAQMQAQGKGNSINIQV